MPMCSVRVLAARTLDQRAKVLLRDLERLKHGNAALDCTKP